MTKRRRPRGAPLLWLAALVAPAGAHAQAADAFDTAPDELGFDSVELCPASASVTGQPAVAADVRALLDDTGLDAAPSEGCPLLEAEVREVDQQVEVRLTEAGGVTEIVVVRDPATAAALIEARARRDLLLPGLELEPLADEAPGGDPVEGAKDVETRTDGVTETSLQAEIDDDAREPERLVASARPFVAAGMDSSTWTGISAGLCGRLGPVCGGIALRGAGDVGVTGASRAARTTRGGFDVLLTLEAPIRAWAFTLTPGIAAGGGWLRAARFPDEALPGVGDPTAQVDRLGLRVGGTFVAALDLAFGISAEVALALTADPLAHTAISRDAGDVIAGDPLARGHIGLGLRYSL